MKKKLFINTIIIIPILLLAACNISRGFIEEESIIINDNGNNANNAIDDNRNVMDSKIMLLSGSISDDEAAYYSAEKNVEIHGSDRIIHKSTPDYFYEEGWFNNFCLELLEDTTVKVLIINPAIEHLPGMFEKIRITLPDILIVTTRAYDVDNISEFADIVMYIDQLAVDRMIPEHAKKLGAKTFVYYSFPRHMEMPILAQQRDLIEDICLEIGLKFVYVEAIDPANDISGAQQFIMRDVLRKVEEFGKDTCFLITSSYIQETLISSVLEQEAIMAQPSYSPYYGFPEALSIDPDIENFWDPKWLNQQIADKIADYGASGRIFAWPVPDSMLIGSAAVEYGLAYCEGLVSRQADKDMLVQCLQKAMEDFGYGDYGVNVNLADGTDNYFLFTEDFITY